MKKICLILIALCMGLGTSNSFAQKSASMQNIIDLYERQVALFFVDVFDTVKTGQVMADTARAQMAEAIYECYISDFTAWAKWTRKYEGEKPFILTFKRKKYPWIKAKDYEKESAEYLSQFTKIQDEFVDLRLTWTEDELKKMLTKERLQKYIDPVVTKFEIRTKTLLSKLKSSNKSKKR